MTTVPNDKNVEIVRQLKEAVNSWNSLIRDVAVPGDLAPALASGRSELISLAGPRSLSAEEMSQVYQVVRCLMDTNRALQLHAAQLAQRVHHLRQILSGAVVMSDEIYEFAEFRSQ